MLTAVKGRRMELTCNKCGQSFPHDIPADFISRRMEPFSSDYENIPVQCPECREYEIFNLNIPVNDTDEPIATGDLETAEEVQRHYIRLLIRTVREDFVDDTKATTA